MVVSNVSKIKFNPQKLVEALKEKKMSQAELARLLGYKHRNIINRMIKNERDVSATELLRLSSIFEKEPNYFST